MIRVAIVLALLLVPGSLFAEEPPPGGPRLIIGSTAFRLPRRAHEVSWSPDGKRIATAGHVLTVLSAETGHLAWPAVAGTSGSGRKIAWSPSGDRIAQLRGNRVTIRRAATGEIERTLVSVHRASVIAWRPDGRHIAVGTMEGKLHFVPLFKSVDMVEVQDHRGITAIAFSPDGDRIATAGIDGTIHIRGQNELSKVHVLAAHERKVLALAWSRDELRIASGGMDPEIRLWDGRLLQATGTLPHDRRPTIDTGVRSLSFSPDGKRLLTAGRSGRVSIWDLAKNRAHREWRFASDAAWSPDGLRTAEVGGAVLRIRDAATGKLVSGLTGHSAGISAVAFSPDRKTLAAGDENGSLRLWNTKTGEERRRIDAHRGKVLRIVWAPDGGMIATTSADWKTKTWIATDGTLVAELPSCDLNTGAVAFSPDGGTVAVGQALCDPRTGKVKAWFHGEGINVHEFEWSSDGTEILASGQIRRWGGCGAVIDAKTGRWLQKFPLVKNHEMTLRFDGDRVVGRSNGLLVTWDAKDGRELSRRKIEWRKYGRPGAWSPDRSRVLLADGSVLLLRTDTIVRRLGTAKLGQVEALCWSSDGRSAALGTAQGRIAIYDVAE